MDGAFFVALLITTLVRVYFVLGFPPELADRGSNRLLGGVDINLWTARLGSVAWGSPSPRAPPSW